MCLGWDLFYENSNRRMDNPINATGDEIRDKIFVPTQKHQPVPYGVAEVNAI
jgi:hypothetical protein